MKRFFSKVLLILIFPFAVLFHKRLRESATLRLKFWAMDRDFFHKERKQLSSIAIVAFLGWALLVYGLPAIVFTTTSVAIKSGDGMAAAHKAAIENTTPDLDKTEEMNKAIKTVAKDMEQIHQKAKAIEEKSTAVDETLSEQADRMQAIRERAKRLGEQQSDNNNN